MNTRPLPLARRLTGAAIIALDIALAIAAVFAFRLRCEGFGCTGVGILWLAWVAAYVPVVVGGLLLRAALPHATLLRRALSASTLALLALGATLAVYWLMHRT